VFGGKLYSLPGGFTRSPADQEKYGYRCRISPANGSFGEKTSQNLRQETLSPVWRPAEEAVATRTSSMRKDKEGSISVDRQQRAKNSLPEEIKILLD
jgi:hypothetical protein